MDNQRRNQYRERLLFDRLSEVASIVGAHPWMRHQQANRLVKLIYPHFERVDYIVEIGTLHGVGSCYLGAIAEFYGGKLTTIDLPWTGTEDSLVAHGKSPITAEELIGLCKLQGTVDVVRRGDGAERWLQEQLTTRGGEFVDVIYLDGGHTLNETATNLLLSWSALRKTGLLVMDDIDHATYPAVGFLWRTSVPLLRPGAHWSEGNWGIAVK